MGDLDSKFESLKKTEYARLGEQVYLDHAGSALYTSTHLQKYFNELQSNLFANPHSGNTCSEHTHAVVYQVRSRILQLFNATDDDYDVVFTSGATEGLHILGRSFGWNQNSIFAYLEDNHTSVVGIREIAFENMANTYCLCLDKSSHEAKASSIETYSSKLVKTAQGDHCEGAFEHNIPCLFAYPAQSNFSGAKYPLQWIEQVQKFGMSCKNFPDLNKTRKWYVLCDAAAFVSTSPLNLQQYHPDFVTISFYKIFGFPTGLGALLVRKESQDILCKKEFFGGGSVSGWLASHDFCKPKPVLHERLEDGSLPFLNILALKHGFDTFEDLGISMHCIQMYTHKLWRYLYNEISALKHANGMPIVELYTVHENTNDLSNQGPIMALNIKGSDGSYVGYNTVLQLANSNNIYIRGGCFCNVGACAFMLNASNDLLLKAYENGHVCGDSVDVIEGKPIGALRVSLGSSSTKSDIERFVEFVSSCFRDDKVPSSMNGILKTHEDQGAIVLEKIVIYPVKSCQGMAVDSWEISKTGLKWDRMWMIVDDHGICVNLKKNPALVSIYPVVSLSKKVLILKAEGMLNIEIPFIDDDDSSSTNCSIHPDHRCVTKVCGDRVEGHDCGEKASLWVSEVLGTKCSLLQKRSGTRRYVKKAKSAQRSDGEISLVNEAQYLLVNLSSVQYLYHEINGFADDVSLDEVEDLARRFRGNFIISGATPFSEDSWTKLAIKSLDDATNGVEGLWFEKRGLCNRCSMICVDPNTGRKLNDPLKTLANLTIGKARRKPTFGVYLQCETKSSTIAAKAVLFPKA